MLESALYIAIAVFMQFALTMNVVRLRRRHKVAIGDGDYPELQRAIRMHGNFIETVPIALLCLSVYENVVMPPFWTVHALGMMLIISRLMHVISLKTRLPLLRVLGMVGTLLAMIIPAGIIMLHYFRIIHF
mgnify:CR=1 FL=1